MGGKEADPAKMKPIPNYPARKWQATPEGIKCAIHRDGPLTLRIGRHPQDKDRTGAWYLRITRPDGRRSYVRVGAHDHPTEKICQNALDLWHQAQQGADKYEAFRRETGARRTTTITEIIQTYLDAGCPTRSMRSRPPAAREREALDLLRLGDQLGHHTPHALTLRILDDYATRRGAPRAVDLELAALKNALAYAVRRGDLRDFTGLPDVRYRAGEDVQHCHHHQPSSDEELHALARWLIEHDRPISAGRMLLEALTGLRRVEPLMLRWDAVQLSPGRWQPGAQIKDSAGRQLLIVQRAKSGRNPGIVIHPALADFLSAWRQWTADHHPAHPYYFPGQRNDTPHRLDQLGRDMQDAAQALGLPKRTSHGLRAFYVSARRSQGADDLTIAAELGQRSGAALVASTYGDPQNIQGDHRLDWLPKDATKPAWKLFIESETIDNKVVRFGT